MRLIGRGFADEAIHQFDPFSDFFNDLWAVVVAHQLPEPLHAVGVKLDVSADDRDIFRQRLREQQSVERIFAMQFHRCEQRRVFWQDWEYFDVVGGNMSFHKRLIRLRK